MFNNLKNIFKMINYSKNKNMRLHHYFLFSIIITLLISFLLIFTPKYLFELLNKGYLFNVILINIILIFILLFISKSLQDLFSSRIDYFSEYLFNEAYREISLKNVTIPYSVSLTKECINLMEGAKYGIWEIPMACKGAKEFGNSIASVLISVTIISLVEWRLLLIPIITNIIAYGVYRKINLIEVSNSKRLLSENRAFGWYCRLISDFSYGKDIRLYHAHDFIQEKYAKLSNKIFKINQETFSKKGFYEGLVKGVLQLQIVILVIILGTQIKNGLLIESNYMLMFGAISTLSFSLNNIQVQTSLLFKLNSLLKPFFDFIDLSNEDSIIPKTKSLDISKDDSFVLEFKDVSFKYPEGSTYVLNNINVQFNKGESIALVGTNGAGKSTLIKLICGLYKPTKGEITLNGINIDSYSISEYRELISTIFQDFKLLPVRLNENITTKYIDDIQNMTNERLNKIIDNSSLNSWIKDLICKEYTYIGPELSSDFVLPSGGQKQSLAISRSIYRQASIYLFDEPTISLDIKEEFSTMNKFNELSKDNLTILVSHRLAHTKFVDKVIVMDCGEIVEIGNHESLLNNKGLYNVMYSKQVEKYSF